MDLDAARRHASAHRIEILASSTCGCFSCESFFAPEEIREWIDESDEGIGQTALCPRCGADAVLGSASGLALTADLLREMNARWAGGDAR